MNLDLGDSPTELIGIASFAVAAWACWRAGRVAGSTWRKLAFLQAAAAIEIATRGRYHLHALVDQIADVDGWYAQRKPVQLVLIALLIVTALTGWIVASRDRELSRVTLIALVVTIGTMLLFAVETVSLHEIDAILYAQVGTVRAVAFGWVSAATIVASSARAAAVS